MKGSKRERERDRTRETVKGGSRTGERERKGSKMSLAQGENQEARKERTEIRREVGWRHGGKRRK